MLVLLLWFDVCVVVAFVVVVYGCFRRGQSTEKSVSTTPETNCARGSTSKWTEPKNAAKCCEIPVPGHLGLNSRRPRHPRALDDEELFAIEGSKKLGKKKAFTTISKTSMTESQAPPLSPGNAGTFRCMTKGRPHLVDALQTAGPPQFTALSRPRHQSCTTTGASTTFQELPCGISPVFCKECTVGTRLRCTTGRSALCGWMYDLDCWNLSLKEHRTSTTGKICYTKRCWTQSGRKKTLKTSARRHPPQTSKSSTHPPPAALKKFSDRWRCSQLHRSQAPQGQNC